MKRIDVSPHVQQSQEKAEWDKKQKEKAEKNQYVTIIDIDIPFMRLVWFLVQIAIATIPAGIIFFIFYSILTGFLVNLIR